MKSPTTIPSRPVAVIISLLLLLGAPLIVSGVVVAGRAVFTASSYQKYENTTADISFNYPRYLDLKAIETPVSDYEGPKLRVGLDYSDNESWTRYDTLSLRYRPVSNVSFELTDYSNTKYYSDVEDVSLEEALPMYRPSLQDYQQLQRDGAVYATTIASEPTLRSVTYTESRAYVDGQEALLITYFIESKTDYTYRAIEKYFYVYNKDYEAEIAVWYVADNERATLMADEYINSIRLPQP